MLDYLWLMANEVSIVPATGRPLTVPITGRPLAIYTTVPVMGRRRARLAN